MILILEQNTDHERTAYAAPLTQLNQRPSIDHRSHMIHGAKTTLTEVDLLGDTHALDANMGLMTFQPKPEDALVDDPQALRMHELARFIDDVNMSRQACEARMTRAAQAPNA
nr:hypothetical protein [Oceanococcus sp. HetDA_MAG_MS8]